VSQVTLCAIDRAGPGHRRVGPRMAARATRDCKSRH
jgi:hypothetical protein